MKTQSRFRRNVRSASNRSFRERLLGGRLAAISFAIALFAALGIGGGQYAWACPFCTSVSHTYSDDLKAATAGVLAEYLDVTPSKEPDGLPLHRLKIVEVLKGPAKTLQGQKIEAFSNAEIKRGQVCFLIACGDAPFQWSLPTPVSADAIRYLKGVKPLTESSRDRLKFCLAYLASSDRLVADDAYNEFARASYAQVVELGDKLDRDWVLARLKERPAALHHRRLLWLLLGICGKPDDARVASEAIERRMKDRSYDPGLDAAIACYMSLGGETALGWIERELLANQSAEYVDTYAAIMAIRVHGDEFKKLPRERLAKSLHQVLGRPPLADLVIPDLTRWEDWSVMGRLVELFEKADDKSQFVKTPVVNYLRACPLPEAKGAIERLRAIDPEAVRRAETFFRVSNDRPNDVPAAREDRKKKAAEAKNARGGKAESGNVSPTDEQSKSGKSKAPTPRNGSS